MPQVSTLTPTNDPVSSLRATLLDAWEAKPRISVTEIAEAHRVIPAGAGSSPGEYRVALTPYWREVQDRLHPDDPAQVVCVEKGAQTGGSTLADNWVFSVMGYYPSRMLYVLDTQTNAEDWSKDTLDSMIDASPMLRGRVRGSTSRAKGETLQGKWFPGGRLRIVGGHSASALCRMAAQYVVMDECDRYKENPGYEGNAVSLVLARQSTYGASRKALIVSTPTVEDDSEVDDWFRKGDQRYYHVPCVRCGERQVLHWRDPETKEPRLVWDPGDPSSARYVCPHCGHQMTDTDKNRFLPDGIWIPSRKDVGDGIVTSYHLSGLYSPPGLLSWSDIVREFEAANTLAKIGNVEKLKSFVNTRLGQTFRKPSEALDSHILQDRVDPDWGEEIPSQIQRITTGSDVQKDRIEVTTVGWGPGWESWVLDHSVIRRSPKDPGAWKLHDEIIRRVWTRQDGQQLRACVSVVDSNYETDEVYRYAKARKKWYVYAIRGDSRKGMIWPKQPSYGGKNKTYQFWEVRVNVAKNELYDHLQITGDRPLRVHISQAVVDQNTDDASKASRSDYLSQLTNERRVKDKSGQWVWEKAQSHLRNEAWDCLVYNLAAAHCLQMQGARMDDPRRWKAVADASDSATVPDPAAPPEPAIIPTPPADRGGPHTPKVRKTLRRKPAGRGSWPNSSRRGELWR